MCAPSAPDTSGMNAAALAQAELSKEQLAWAKEIYAETAPQRAESIARANKVSDAQLASMEQNTEISKDYWDYQTGTFRPLEKGIVEAADQYDTPERQAAAASKAAAEVEMALDNVQGQQTRQLTRSGVNPASGAALSLSSAQGLEKAKLLADAENKAREGVELQGYARKMDAANLGRNLASNQATSAGVALNAGNSASANGQAAGNITAQGNQIMTQGFSGAQQGLSGAATTYGNIANIQNTANANESNHMLNMAKTGAIMLSDKKAKKNVKPVSGKASLSAFKKLPVSNWNYKKGKGDGGNHTGPMAQDVRKGLGDKTAPGGKVIDMISLAGHTINAIKELDKRVAGLESGRRK
jgi:hypothetical protein